MTFEGLLPIGSVVLLKNASKRLMIIGVCRKEESGKIWDYAGCLYPEGFISADETFLFDGEQIEKVFAVGYQDQEQFEFKVKADELMKSFREAE